MPMNFWRRSTKRNIIKNNTCESRHGTLEHLLSLNWSDRFTFSTLCTVCIGIAAHHLMPNHFSVVQEFFFCFCFENGIYEIVNIIHQTPKAKPLTFDSNYCLLLSSWLCWPLTIKRANKKEENKIKPNTCIEVSWNKIF